MAAFKILQQVEILKQMQVKTSIIKDLRKDAKAKRLAWLASPDAESLL